MRKTTVLGGKVIALVDADGILYAAALRGQTMCDGKPLQLIPLSKVYEMALERLEEQADWVDAEDIYVCLSDRRNFRTDLLPSYKGNRKSTDRPVMLDALRTMFVEKSPHRVLLIPGLEADDVCGIFSGHLQAAGLQPIIISPDKDLLQIPGRVCTPLANGKHPISEITLEAADRWHMIQTLTGDTVDNYKGCPGVGPVKAGILMDYCEAEGFSLGRTWGEVIDQFYAANLTQEDCLVQARVSRILRSTDWDAKGKKPILFTFPKDRMKSVWEMLRETANDEDAPLDEEAA